MNQPPLCFRRNFSASSASGIHVCMPPKGLCRLRFRLRFSSGIASASRNSGGG